MTVNKSVQWTTSFKKDYKREKKKNPHLDTLLHAFAFKTRK